MIGMRLFAVFGFAAALAACGAPPTEQTVDAQNTETSPPPLPEGVETVDFEAEREASQSPPSDETQDAKPAESKTVYWGVKEGEALPLMWEDLMPEGSEEELMRQYEDFYAMLEKRYAANTTTLADAADPYARIEEGSDLDFMPQLGTFDTVEDLDGEFVRIPGYAVPFDFEANSKWREFLFVPYMGACIHTPPPPPNQLILVRADPAVRVDDIWAPYFLEGTLSTEKTENDLGDTAYTMQMSSIEPYQ